MKYSTDTHTSDGVAIMDSGNNLRHSFKSLQYFPYGVRYHNTDITGVHGKVTVRVGTGTACFSTQRTDGSPITWSVPDSVYNPTTPVNLLCMNRFHYTHTGTDTGHEWLPKRDKLLLKDGRELAVTHDRASALPLVHIAPHLPIIPSLDFSGSHSHLLLEPDLNQHFTHTHLPTLTSSNVMCVLNSPVERVFNSTVRHNLLEGIEQVQPIARIDKSNRPEEH